MSQDVIQLTLDLHSRTDADELLDFTARLREELAETDVESVRPGRGAPPPAYTKGVDPETAQLLITLAVGVVPSVILAIQSFLLRQKDQTLKIKIKEVELEVPRHASEEEIKRLVKLVEKLAKKVN